MPERNDAPAPKSNTALGCPVRTE